MKASVSKTCLIGPAITQEQFIAEHLFFYLVKGTVSGDYGGKSHILESDEYGIVRKNRLGRQNNARKHDDVEKIIFVFDEPFLKAFQEKHQINPVKFPPAESFIQPGPNALIPGFIQSLTPYYNVQGEMDKAFFDLKREELLLILLQIQPELSGVFFDYGIPGKIDLEEFMQQNYKFNASIERFAYLTGRSLSAFKRDFKTIFNDTPNHWLVQKRLQEAHFLLEKTNKKASEIYLDLGFEALSHFSFAFKKLFGQTPTELAEQKKHTHK
ncbi:helix-turn-helix domain-containing protein [Mucilaginibacter lappiensis]|uniref:AraC-like DNA-binding protein n=1 Tax=Mucilaginibacter lappiensis TaxID=354630 RepID=A0A841JJX1_9SPHI|nr:AraC family transcriptional regulator [Mucilaginibacter lappiensis]MBB6128695.1 AraC-like DNA-binding protein [Mucilaginibacter lappiensis]